MSNSQEEIEVKVAFLEEAVTKMSDEFYAQQKELHELKSLYAALLNKLKNAETSDSGSTEVHDERPPHY